MQITLGQGVDNILFGQTETEIILMWGQPDKTYATDHYFEDASDGSKRLQYFQRLVEFGFDYDNESRLSRIEVKHPDATLFDCRLLGQRTERVLSTVSAVITETPEIDDYGSFESYFYDSVSLELQFEMGRLISINFGHLWEDDDTPFWPEPVYGITAV